MKKVLPLLSLLLLTSCRATLTDHHTRTDTLRTRDTIYLSRHDHTREHLLDSVATTRYTRADTVYITQARWRTLTKERTHTDTLYKERTRWRTRTHTREKRITTPPTIGQRLRWLLIGGAVGAAIALALCLPRR